MAAQTYVFATVTAVYRASGSHHINTFRSSPGKLESFIGRNLEKFGHGQNFEYT